jgi:hypothetical protein
MKALFLTLTFLITTCAFAQEDIYKKIAQETCDCINSKDLTGATRKSVEMSLGLCMIEKIQNASIQIDIQDPEQMRSFGEKVGIQMAPICPSIFAYFTDEQPEAAPTFESVNGKIKAIEEGDFLTVILKDSNGKETKLLWLRYFTGSDDYLENPKSLIGKQVSIKYQLIEAYMPKAKGYFSFKEIVEMTF